MTTKKKAATRKPTPKPANGGKSGADDQVLNAAYEQGRAARRARISREDAPHGDGPLLKAWQKGFDFEQNAGR